MLNAAGARIVRPVVRRQLAGLIVMVGAIGLAAYLFSPRSLSSLARTLADRPLAFGGVLLLIYIVRPLVAWPVVTVSLAVGYVYGILVGLPIALLGAVGTCLPPYFVGRCWDPKTGPVGTIGDLGRRSLDRTGDGRGIVAARLLPFPADAVSYAAGLSGATLPAFLAGTAVGEVPWTVAAVVAGSSAERLLSTGLDLWVAIGIGIAGVVLLLPVAYETITAPDR